MKEKEREGERARARLKATLDLKYARVCARECGAKWRKIQRAVTLQLKEHPRSSFQREITHVTEIID